MYFFSTDGKFESNTHVQADAQTQLHNTRHGNDLLKDFESFDSQENLYTLQKTQLEMYLEEPRRKIHEPLDVLDYWKSNQFRYPELARMARDILSIPISTVASEAAFSVGGRVIDQFRSALLPENVESLVCSNDWLFKKKDVLAPTLEELSEDLMQEMRDAAAQSQQGSNAPV
ncbi:hypothetical protein ACHQM5_017046 [Ranunculus cassubicifolius]